MMHGVLPLVLSAFILPSATVQKDWERIRGTAESQHEIILLLIDDGQFDKALQQASDLCRLPMPEVEEHRLVDSIKIISDAFHHNKKSDLALRLLDEALKVVRQNEHKAQLYREKAYIFQDNGLKKDAMEAFRKAMELENP